MSERNREQERKRQERISEMWRTRRERWDAWKREQAERPRVDP